MRGCLFVLLLAVGLVLAATWFGGPTVAGVVIERSLDSAGFVAGSRTVTVASDPPLEILAGRADRVTIQATDAVLHDLRAARLSLTLGGVDLVGRQFSTANGQLDNVSYAAAGGPTVRARSIVVRGRAASATATVRVAGSVVEGLLIDAIREQTGFRVTGVTLSAPDRVRFTAGLSLEGRFIVAPDGSLGVALASGGSPFKALDPPANLRLTSATVEGSDLVLVGTIDLTDLLR